MKMLKNIFSAIVLLLLILSSIPSSGQMKTMGKMDMHEAKTDKLKSNMRVLWEDHIAWTRNVIFCIADGLPGKAEALKRLLKNQEDIGNAIKPYYG